MTELAGRVYIVTGGATGIGAGISSVLREQGARIHVFDLSNADVRDRAAVERQMTAVVDAEGRIDGLVNNAALTGLRAAAPFLETPDSLIDDVIATNLKGPVYCSQAFGRMARERGGGAIVHVSSVGAFAAQEHAAIYCATKAALTSLTQSMAIELAPHGIRVNAVAPGDIETDASRGITAQLAGRGASGRFVRATPLGYRGTPRDIGEAVAFLLSDRASFITGSTLLVDGGFLAY